MHDMRSAEEPSFWNIAIMSSAGSRLMGDTRRLSAISWASESPNSSGRDSASEDWESLSFNMKESLSSSIHLSGEVDADEVEFAPLEKRRAILRVGRMLIAVGRNARREAGGEGRG